MENILGRTRRGDIRFYTDGKIEISSKVTKQLGMYPGDVLNVGVDSGQYYIYHSQSSVVIGRHEGLCRSTNPGGRHLRTYSKRLCQAVMHLCETDRDVSLCVGELTQHPVFGAMMPLIIRRQC